MAKTTLSFPVALILLLTFSLNAGMTLATWCVAKPSTSDLQLQKNIQFVCSESGYDCGLIQPGGPCSVPNTTINHASVVMNLFFKNNGWQVFDCYFNNSGLIAITDPSYDNCFYKL